jgi:cytoskeletal protein RodZ
VDSNQLETAASNLAPRASLGESLTAVRQQRGLSRETVVEQTRIPKHYLQMLEDDDYRLISDRLYLLPFLRKYASFLDIDQDETAMRLLRDVQRADNSPAPARLDQPLDAVRRYRRRNWSKPIIFGGLIAVIIGAWIVQSRHNDTDTTLAPSTQSSQAAVVSPSSFAARPVIKPLPAPQSAGAASQGRSDSSLPQQATPGTRLSPRQRSQPPAMVVTVASPNEAPASPRRKTPDTRQALNR